MESPDDRARAGAPTETAVVVPVAAAPGGVPAHVTVLHPFLPPGAIDEMALVALGAAVRSVPAFDVTFTATEWFGDEVVQLRPVRGALPVRQRIDHALLIAGSPSPRSWRTLHRLPLG